MGGGIPEDCLPIHPIKLTFQQQRVQNRGTVLFISQHGRKFRSREIAVRFETSKPTI